MSHRKRLVSFLIGALMVGPVPAFQIGEQGKISFDDRELALLQQRCHLGQGCTIVHRDLLARGVTQALMQAYAEGVAAGRTEQAVSCKGST